MRPLYFLLLWPAVVHAQQIKPGELVTARFGAGGTWNLYQASEKSMTWTDAQELAAGLKDPAGGTDKKGHLVTISSAMENQFVYHFLKGSYLWIGLTDNEKYPGAKEAGASQDKGWAWVNGEPLTYTNWETAMPTDACELPEGITEDAVAIEANGFWNDRHNGDAEQGGSSYPFLIEWDVQSKEPVPGARVIGAALPAQWPAIKELPPENKGPWVCVSTENQGVEPRMMDSAKMLLDGWNIAETFRMQDCNFQTAESAASAAATPGSFGWISVKPAEFPGKVTGYFGMIARARLVIPKAGLYTFNMHVDDTFALRLGKHPWKSATGNGGIDPNDPSTLLTLLTASDSDTRGVIELPAGEVPVEFFYLNSGGDGRVQILTAEGAQPLDGSTSDWRMLGYKPAAKVPWPGITADGWKVTIPAPGKERKVTPKDKILTALMRVEEEASTVTKGVDVINFHDPECSRRARFPGPVPFPNDPPGPQDDRVVLATAVLEVPADGLYHIGISGDDLCGIQMEGKKWERIVRDSSGKYAKVDEDTILCRKSDNKTSHEIMGEIKLTKGQHTIRAVSWDQNGNSVVQVYAAPAGWPARLLKKNGMAEEPDLPGLEVKPFQP